MEGFLAQVAQRLYKEYGDDISSIKILFPSRRARLFFVDALSKTTDKPIWQPTFITVDEVMEQMSGLYAGEPIRLIAELYKVYSKFHKESFDSFYFWGEMLLADFDSVDKYMIDADMLFTNISDIKAIESDISYLTKEQIEVIARFWNSLGKEIEFSEEKKKFMAIWQTLSPIYHQFKAALEKKELAYTGMVHRVVAEGIKNNKVDIVQNQDAKHYAIVGFNALTECEKTLFGYLEKNHKVDFFWDYDNYYLADSEQEAGLFLRDNVRRFPQKLKIPHSYNTFAEKKNVTVVSAPSDSLQCKYVAEYIDEIKKSTGNLPDKESAVVLTDENLLIPTLYSIPSEVDKINVTMGYPLKMTVAYTFAERLIELQSRKRKNKYGTSFYHSDVVGLLNHPFVGESHQERAQSLNAEIVERQQIHINSERLREEGAFFEALFSPVEDWQELADYIEKIIANVITGFTNDAESSGKTSDVQKVEFLTIVADNINKVRNSVVECEVDLSMQMFASLLRKVLQNIKVPYEGEPLEGIQVMGILETRNLDFENVLILSVNDDTFPGNRAVSSSFIPYNLRFAYGLPTPTHHEGVYAYYFYRLLQRAKNIHIVYSSRSDEKSSGEQSRYIYQLEYESPHSIKRVNLGLDVNHSEAEPIVVEKSNEVWNKLGGFLHQNAQDGESAIRLSPTSFSNYVACPLKFYFYSVAKLSPEEEITEDVDAPMFGSILHKAMQLLYQPRLGKDGLQAYLKSLIGSEEVDKSVDDAIREEFFNKEEVEVEDYSGNLLLVREIVIKYINTCVLPYDSGQEEFRISQLEERIRCDFDFKSATDNGEYTVSFGGIADRIDLLKDGSYRIVDYKTGKENLDFKGVDAIFAEKQSDQNPAALQTLLYAMMVYKTKGFDAQPALYYVRSLNRKDYSPLINDKGRGVAVRGYLDYAHDFEAKLTETLQEIFNKNIPFTQCKDVKHCEWCDFKTICRR